MINKIIDFLKKYELEDKTIIVGFSGGFDSMCLLDILSKIKLFTHFDMDIHLKNKYFSAHFEDYLEHNTIPQ